MKLYSNQSMKQPMKANIMTNNRKGILGIALITLCSGCAMPSKVVAPPDENKKTSSDQWQPTLVLSRDSYDYNNRNLYHAYPLENAPKPAFVLPGNTLDETEVKALIEDKNAFYVFMQNPTYKNSKKVAFVFKQGSVKDNAIRVSKLFDVTNIEWDLGFDYNLDSTSSVVANSKEELLSLLLEPFPLEAKIITRENVRILRVSQVGEIDKEYRFTVFEGSFKENFQRLSDMGEFDGEWHFDYDFNIPDTYVVRGTSYEDILATLIRKYNLPVLKTKED